MTVRVGFLGGGFIATFHSKMLRAATREGLDVTWAGVHDPDPAKAATFASASGAPRCDTVDEVLDRSDAVFVCTWTAEHPRLVEAAAARRLPVFCEKPLAVDLPGALAMARTVRGAAITNQVGLILRRSPAFLLARELLRDARAGRPMSVVFRDDQYLPIQGQYQSDWRADPAKAGSGALLEHSIHDCDILEWLLGPVAVVNAHTATVHDVAGIEDNVAASFTFANGAMGVLTSVWHDLLERPSLRRIEVFCERLHIVIEGDWYGPVRWTFAGGEEGVLEGADLEAAVTGSANPDAEFIRAVTDGRPAQPDFEDALRAHVVVDALYRSAAAGGAPVEVPAGTPT
jgi:myo-inositol 2-dehydrogenase/D-chiro-inositol 1-dehydrogenase